MSRLYIVLFFMSAAICFVVSHTAYSDQIIADGEITKTIIYHDRAMVFRQAQVRLAEGSHQILFKHLPGSILADSLHVSSFSDPVKIVGVSSRRETLEEQKEARQRHLMNQIRRLEDDLQIIVDEERTLNEQIEFLRKVGESAADVVADELVRGGGSSFQWQDLYRTLTEQIRGLRRTIREQAPKKRDLEERIENLYQEMERVGENLSDAYEIVVDVEAASPVNGDISLSYVVQGARWTPTYDVRYLEEEEVLNVSYHANVRQRTGKAWPNVELTLSTGKPLLYGRPKDLSPWNVGFASSLKTTATNGNNGESRAAKPTDTSSDKTDTVPLFQPADLGAFALEYESDEIAFSFQLPTPETIPSGTNDSKVTIANFRFPARLQYIAIPRQGPYTFLRAVMTNNSNYPLLSGDANIFLGSDFLSTTTIHTTMPGAALDFYLGTDPHIEVRQTELERTLDSSGLILTTGQQITWRWRLDIINRRDSRIVLEVVDQLPVPKHEDIKLEDFRCRNEEYSLENNGIVRWILELAPKAERTILYSYKLKFPKDTVLSGLER